MKQHTYLRAFVIIVMLLSSIAITPAVGLGSPAITGTIIYVDVDATGNTLHFIHDIFLRYHISLPEFPS